MAGGAALVEAAGGAVMQPDGSSVVFNRENPRLPGFVAVAPQLRTAALALIARVG